MKKNLIALGVMLISTLSLTNCTEEFQTAPEAEKTPFTIFANHEVGSKTLNDGLSTLWAEGDELAVFHTENGTSYYSESTLFSLTDVETGQFDTENLSGELSAVNDWFVFYPYSEYMVSPAIEYTGYVTVGADAGRPQTQTGNNSMAHISGQNYPMWGTAKGVESAEMPYVRMTHLSSLVEVVVTNTAEVENVVWGISLTAPEAVTGTYYVDFTTDVPLFEGSGEEYVSNVVSLKVMDGDPIAVGESASFYFALKPFTAPAGEYITLSVNGVDKVIELTDDVVFSPGKIKTLKFNLDEYVAPSESLKVTVAEYLDAEEDETLYTLTGMIKEVANTKFGNFYLADDTGEVYIYGLVDEAGKYVFTDLGLKAGDIITVTGTRGSYHDMPEMIDALYVSHEVGELPEPDVPEPDVPEIVVATVEEVLAAEVSTDVWYEMTGTISNIKNTTYGNFDLVDETGSIYVYGLTATQVEKNDKSFASLGLKEGDIVTIVGTRAEYKGTPQIGGPAYYVSHVEGEEPEELVPGPYTSNILWTLGANAYDQEANVNDESKLPVLKLGTSSKVGEATFSLPAGTTKVGFYAVSWEGKPATVALKCNDVQIASVDAPVNEGAIGNPTYTIEADEASCYFEIEINAEEDTKYTLTTTSSNKRVIIWGLNYYTADGIGEDQVEEEPEPEPDVPAEIVAATVEEVLAAEVSTDVWYEMTGTISNIKNTTYGNFDLVDETGSIYVYGLTATQVEKNDMSFASLGLKEGDIVTIIGTRSEYNGTAQVGGPAYYVSHVPGEEPEPEPEPEDPEDPADGTVASAVFADMGYGNAQDVADETIWLDDNVSLVFSQGAASTAPTYYDSGSAIRMYQNGATLDVEANGKTITSIELTFSNNQYYLASDCGELSAEASVRTWTGESTAVKFTSTGTDKNHRAYVSAIKVVYAD